MAAAGIKVYIKAVTRQQKIPLTLKIENKTGREKLREAIETIQAQSVLNGTNSMTMDEINDIIDECR